MICVTEFPSPPLSEKLLMAESFIFSMAESLIEKLASRAYEEASLALGVHDDLRDTQKTLSFIKAVLLDAEQKQEQGQNHELGEWLRQIKQVLSDAEDVLDEFECEALRKQVVKAHGSTMRKVRRFFSSSNPLVFRLKMAHQIKDIKERLDKVAANRDKFGLQTNDVDKRVVHRRERETHSHVNAFNVIGRDQDKEKIIKLLMQPQPNGNDDGSSLSVISIVGIGGMGKTTLAKLVFNDKRINDESFPMKMWVCVSDDFDIKKLLIKIINSADVSTLAPPPLHQENMNNLDIEQLQSRLRNKLADQKFLLVLDDVWNNDRDKWDDLRDLLQVGAKGSKILVTTRSNSIASMMSTIDCPYTLKGLSLEESFSLFVKRAFKEGQEKRYPDLMEMGKEIVKKCKGVPLAVRTLGSSLYSKVDIKEWESVKDNEIWNTEQKKGDILPALKLSYDQMPSYLRRCFVCFSLFPKDYVFNDFKVTELWGTLGLLPSPKGNKTLEDVGKQYLYELQSRSFLQDFVDYHRVYFFRMHDLVHDLALYVGKDEFQPVNFHTQYTSQNVRHLSFVDNDLLGQAFVSKFEGGRLRTILFPTIGVGFNCGAVLKTWVSRYKYLRFLDLSDSSIETLPHSIGKLKHLRYFSLSDNLRIKRVPDSICNLQNLQILNLYGCKELETLPKGLRNLINLRQLEMTTKQSVLPEDDIADISSLQILVLKNCDNVESLFQGLKVPNIKFLGIDGCKRLKCLPLDHLPGLEIFGVTNCGKLDLLEIHDDHIPNLKLKLLHFSFLPQLVSLPQWIQGAANTLQTLLIQECHNLEMLPVWLPTLSSLTVIRIDDCQKLLSLPGNIHCLTALERLEISACPKLSRKCQPQVGEYWPKISHVKHIVVDEPEDEEKVDES